MLERLWNKRTLVVSACFVLAAILLIVMPPEAKLGQKVRLVYFHASIAENSIIFFVLAAAFALGWFARKNAATLARAKSFFLVAFYLWIAQTFLGGLNMKIIWGHFFWSEPKARLGLVLLAASLLVYLAGEALSSEAVVSTLYVAMGALAVVGLLFTSNVFHPENAIFGSDVLVYKVIFPVLVVLFFVVGLLWSHSILKKLEHAQ